MTRSVADAAALLGVLAGVDPRDPATAAAVGKIAADYTSFLRADGLKGARIGVVRTKFFGYSPEADALVETALGDLARLGATLVDPADVPHLGEYDDSEFEVLLYEFKTDLNSYLAALGPGSPVRTLDDIIAFNDAHRDQELPYFGQELFVKAAAKGPLTDAAYTEALAKNLRLSRAEGLDAVLQQHSLDALVAPTGSPAWPIDLVNGDHFLGASSTPAAVAGYPTITLPVGYSFGLPIGMTFIGPAWSEGKLLQYAYAYEQAMKPRRPPRFLLTVDFTAT
jgi:amidase